MPTLTDAVNTLVSNTTTLQTTVSGRITDMDGKIASADSAKVAAETAKAGAEVAKGLADTAKTDAITAQTLAENAKTAAETAQGIAATAKTDALTAKAATDTAKGNAIAAQSAAEAANTLAQDWASKTSGAVSGGEHSAKYHATAASTSASAAATTLADRYTKAETDAKVVELSPPATKAHVDSLGINAATLTGSLPAISGASLTGISGPRADQVYAGQWDFTLEGAGNSAGHDLGTYSASPGKYLVELVMRSTQKHSDPDGAYFQLNVDGVSLGIRNYIQCQEITNDYSVSGQDSTAVGIIPVEITSTTIMRFHAWDSDNDTGGWIGRWQARVIRIG